MAHVAFLREINVGGVRIAMADLTQFFLSCGFTRATNILQTGNVILQSKAAGDDCIFEGSFLSTLEAELSARFNYTAYVQIYSLRQLKSVVDAFCFAKCDSYHSYVVFVSRADIFQLLAEHATAAGLTCSDGGDGNSSCSAETVSFGDQVVYWTVPKGESTTAPFARLVQQARFKTSVTMRNIKTLEKILQAALP